MVVVVSHHVTVVEGLVLEGMEDLVTCMIILVVGDLVCIRVMLLSICTTISHH